MAFNCWGKTIITKSWSNNSFSQQTFDFNDEIFSARDNVFRM